MTAPWRIFLNGAKSVDRNSSVLMRMKTVINCTSKKSNNGDEYGKVYADHASASPVRKEVLDAVIPYFGEYFGNPSNVYDMGSEIKQTIEEQRAKLASLIGANPDEIIFTSSGAEVLDSLHQNF